MTGLVPSHRHLQPGQGHPEGERASLADETIEMLMFVRGNKHHIMIFCKFF
jgi:hypothetical protein